MTSKLVRPLRFAALLCIVALASGCVFTISTNPDSYPAAAGDFPALAGTRVNIVNSAPASYMAKLDGNLQADLQDLTQTAVTVLGRTLEKKGAVLAADGKRVVLDVTSVEWRKAMGTARATVSLHADLGAAKVSAWGEAAGVDASRDCSAAIAHAVEDLLRKPEMRSYLSGR